VKKASEGEKFCECLTQTEAKTKPESQQNHKTSQKIASNCLEYFLEICEQRKFFSADSAKNTASDTDVYQINLNYITFENHDTTRGGIYVLKRATHLLAFINLVRSRQIVPNRVNLPILHQPSVNQACKTKLRYIFSLK